MNKMLLALDLDDTLLTSEKTISDETIIAMNQMLDEGHFITIDSGRPIFGMKPVTSKYDIFKRENVFLLGMQGGLGYYPYEDRLLFINYLDNKAAINLARIVKEEGITFLGFDENYMYTFEINDEVLRYNVHSESEIKLLNSPEDICNIKLCKIIVCSYHKPESLLLFKEKYDEDYKECFISMFSCPYFLEYINKDTDKGKGLLKLADYLGVLHENTIACGDERNDISMIKAAGIGVCVSNGAKEAKAVANYVTIKDNNNGAIAEVINNFILK